MGAHRAKIDLTSAPGAGKPLAARAGQFFQRVRAGLSIAESLHLLRIIHLLHIMQVEDKAHEYHPRSR